MIKPNTIPTSLSVFERPPDEEEDELLSGVEVSDGIVGAGLASSVGSALSGTGVLMANVGFSPLAGFVGALASGDPVLAGVTGRFGPKPEPDVDLGPVNLALHRGHHPNPEPDAGPIPRLAPQPPHFQENRPLPVLVFGGRLDAPGLGGGFVNPPGGPPGLPCIAPPGRPGRPPGPPGPPGNGGWAFPVDIKNASVSAEKIPTSANRTRKGEALSMSKTIGKMPAGNEK